MKPPSWTPAFLALVIFTFSSFAEIVENITVTRATNASIGSNIVTITATVLPGTNLLVESSPNLLTWGPASATWSNSSSAFIWQTMECAAIKERFYRLVMPPSSFTNRPVGRLTRPTPTGPFLLTTLEGWHIRIATNALRITDPSSNYWYELFGQNHENFKGKHIKDMLGSRRSVALTNDTLITVSIDPTRPPTPQSPMGGGSVSIYDGIESHRINFQPFALEWSGVIPRYGESDEFDGETSRFVDIQDGLRWENYYDQGNPCTNGLPQKIFYTVPLGQGYSTNQNRVDDFFDDPRLGHT
jgi:hypothetical protein